MRTVYFDCFSGAAGDMLLGALLDAGVVALTDVRHAVGSLAIAPETIWTERVTRAGITATKFCVRGEGVPASPSQAHDHEGGHHAAAPRGPRTRAHETRHHTQAHPHRTLAEIDAAIGTSRLSDAGKARASRLFRRLGEAEAAVHGVSLEQVHLHEVGALDSIVDIIGTVHAMERLDGARIVASPLNVGSGTVRSAHGVYPVPAPATARLLVDVPIHAGPQRAEMTTPTGALLVTEYAGAFGEMPPMRVERIGYGAGTRDFADTPNVLRVLIGESAVTSTTTPVVVIEAEIDDMNPQIFGLLMDRLLTAGALDVFYTAIQMKKNRPGTLLTLVCAPADRERLTSLVFHETTTIGVRYREMQRDVLDREVVTVETALGPVRVKVARRDGRIVNASPEFDDCVALATRHDRPVKDVQAMAGRAFADRPTV